MRVVRDATSGVHGTEVVAVLGAPGAVVPTGSATAAESQHVTLVAASGSEVAGDTTTAAPGRTEAEAAAVAGELMNATVTRPRSPCAAREGTPCLPPSPGRWSVVGAEAGEPDVRGATSQGTDKAPVNVAGRKTLRVAQRVAPARRPGVRPGEVLGETQDVTAETVTPEMLLE